MKTLSFKPFVFAFLVASSASSLVAQPDHTTFTRILSSHVRSGHVDYASIKKDSRFEPYLASLSNTKASSLSGNDILAFWINVYNAYTIKLICDNYPLKSIRDLAQGKVWDRPLVTIDGTMYSLNEIENDVIRPMGDRRIHFALVCAARSCPPLRSEAYLASRLDEQLNEQATNFLADTTLNAFDLSIKRARLSHVFEWYLADFGKTHAQLLRVLSVYAPSDARIALENTSNAWTVEWKDYDWSLNGK